MTVAFFNAKLTFWKLVVWERVKYAFMDVETLGKNTNSGMYNQYEYYATSIKHDHVWP